MSNSSNQPPVCPSSDVLERLAAQGASSIDSGTRTHLDSCPHCKKELDRIRRNNDLLARYATPSLAGRGAVTGTLPEEAISGYRLVREIHRGGQGVVYEAMQLSPQRRVAVKVMKEGPFAGPGDKARFDREVRILAQLKHPSIVAIHDSGRAAGHYYFVMDYVEGLALDEFLAKCPWPLEEKLDLFARVCDAVNTAHLLGIIHRDLKPGNILIDDQNSPHILDFGLAKMAESATEATLMTATGQFIGSAPWASPEQAQGEPSRIGVRTDVYALGIMFYHLLTGRFPYEVTGSLGDVLNRIQHAEPAPPSTVRRKLNDELDTIALKCLQKDPERRYETAGALARDIRHYLAGEPIAAKRDSYLYVLRKQVSRYRAPLAAAAVFVLLLIAGLTTSLTFWRQAAQQRDEARLARDDAELAHAEAEKARSKAEEQRGEAERQTKIANAVSEFFVNMVASADPEKSGRDVTVREVVQDAARKLEDQFKDDPETESTIRIQVGVTLFQLGQYAEAEPQFRRTLALNEQHFGPTHKYTLSSLAWLSFVLQKLHKFDEALVLQETCTALHKQALGAEHEESWGAMNNLAMLYNKLGRRAEAEALYREVLDMIIKTRGETDTRALSSFNNLALLLRESGKIDEAEAMVVRALELSRKVRGPEHPRTLVLWSNRADLLSDRGLLPEAEAMYREVLPIMQRVYGADHPTALACAQCLSVVIRAQGRLSEAEEMTRSILDRRLAALGPDHAEVALSRQELGQVLMLQNRAPDALPILENARAALRRTMGEQHWNTASAEQSYGDCLAACGRLDEARESIQHACALFASTLGDSHRRTRECITRLAELNGSMAKQ